MFFEGHSNVYWFEGNFQDYEENRKKRLGGDIVPHRMKYRKLVRGCSSSFMYVTPALSRSRENVPCSMDDQMMRSPAMSRVFFVGGTSGECV